MTVLEAIQKSSEFLEKKGIESPRLNVEWLLAHVLQTSRLKLYLEFERVLSREETDRLRELIRQRGQHVPLQHLMGSAAFCGLTLAVSPDVLIPRPETEQLAEYAKQFLCQRVEAGIGSPRGLDWGTGSGCLAIFLAIECPEATIDAVDVTAEALATARKNAAAHGVTDRLQFFQGDGFDALSGGSQYDVIVANPPYIPTDHLEGLQAEVRDHDPRIALDGGADGLTYHRRLAVEARPCLRRGGRLILEFGWDQADALRDLFQSNGWKIVAVEPDEAGHERFLMAGRDDDPESES